MHLLLNTKSVLSFLKAISRLRTSLFASYLLGSQNCLNEVVRVHIGFGTLWKLIMPFSMTWKILVKGGLPKWLLKRFGFLFGDIIKYPYNVKNLVKFLTP